MILTSWIEMINARALIRSALVAIIILVLALVKEDKILEKMDIFSVKSYFEIFKITTLISHNLFIMKIRLLACFLFLTQVGFTLSAQSTQYDLNHLDKYYEKMVTDWDVPSMTIGIVKDGALIFSKGYGVNEIYVPDGSDYVGKK